MRHAGFRETVLLAGYGVPWPVASSWSPARRLAALTILREERPADRFAADRFSEGDG